MKTNKNLLLITCAAAAIGSNEPILAQTNGAAGPSERSLRPYTLDDYLALEATDAGAASGDRIVWEQAGPYDEIGYYGHDHVGAWGSSGFTLHTLDLSASPNVAQPLFDAEPGTSYWIDSFSPDGRYLAFHGANEGVFFMGAYDTRDERVHAFEATPLVDWLQGAESVWVSPDEFVFTAYAGDAQPLAASRPYTGRRLAAEWEKAWSGGVSVSIAKSGLSEGGQNWKPGRLYRANARTGALTLLAEGKYVSLKVSADGRFLAALRQADLSPADPSQSTEDWIRARSQLVVFDLEQGGSARPAHIIAPEKNVFPETLAWAPDANRLAFFAWDLGDRGGVRSGVFHAFDAETGAVIAYPHHHLDLASERERGFYQKPERVMWVDGRLAVFARKHEGVEPRLTYRDIGEQREVGTAHWFLLDAEGRSENLTAQFEAISPIPMHADAETITVLADGDIWRVGPGRKPENLTATVDGELHYPSFVEYSTLHPGRVLIAVGRLTDGPVQGGGLHQRLGRYVRALL